MTILAVAAGLMAAFWLALAIHPLRRFPRDHFLRVAEPAGEGPRVAVLVPARDEAAMLPLTLPSLLGQDYPDFEVVLIDDGSSDGTARVAAELGKTHRAELLRLVAAGEKPPGWAGKIFALQRGVETVVEPVAVAPPAPIGAVQTSAPN